MKEKEKAEQRRTQSHTHRGNHAGDKRPWNHQGDDGWKKGNLQGKRSSERGMLPDVEGGGGGQKGKDETIIFIDDLEPEPEPKKRVKDPMRATGTSDSATK